MIKLFRVIVLISSIVYVLVKGVDENVFYFLLLSVAILELVTAVLNRKKIHTSTYTKTVDGKEVMEKSYSKEG